MDFSVGQEVRVKATGEIGEILEIQPEGILMIDIDGDDIPVPMDYVEPYHEEEARYAPNPTQRRAQQLHPDVVKGRSEVTDTGVILAFETRYNIDGDPEKYRVYLINDTLRDVVFDFRLSAPKGFHSKKLNGVVCSNTAFPLYELLVDALNDNPRFGFDLWPTGTDGSRGAKIKAEVKVKPKTFFNREGFAPVINNGEALVYTLATADEVLERVKEEGNDLREYTRQKLNERRQKKLVQQLAQKYAVREKAAFPKDIDLHIEKLVPYSDDLNPSEILEIQLDAFEQYIEEAIRVGVESVYVIHGGGKGTLRNKVCKRLERNAYVHKLEGGFHHGYGAGATKVIFKK